jgi:hypothetical protein
VSSAVPVLESANPRALPRALVAVCALLIAVGAVAFFAGLATDAETAWRAYHVNFIYFAGLSQGGLVLACAMVIIGAHWPGPVRHVAAALAAWVPITFVLACVSFFGREAIYTEWIHGPPHGKEAWLNIPRLYITDLAILGVMALLSQRFLKASLRPALHGAAERARGAKGLFERWAADWRGDEEERADSEQQLKRLAPIICLLYAFGYTVIAYDQVMSLSPTWFSNIFGWYFGWGGFLSGVAATALISVLLRSSPGWEAEITRPRMHDLGKMVFAFSIFWMYLFFSQYIVIWYGRLAVSPGHLVLRALPAERALREPLHGRLGGLLDHPLRAPDGPAAEAVAGDAGDGGRAGTAGLLVRAQCADLALAGSRAGLGLAGADSDWDRRGLPRRLRAGLSGLQPGLPHPPSSPTIVPLRATLGA